MITLFVGDTETVGNRARTYDINAYPIDHDNWQSFVSAPEPNSVIYSSLADLPKITDKINAMWDLITIADQILYHPTSIKTSVTGFSWEFYDDEFLQYLLFCASKNGKSVIGLPQIPVRSYCGLESTRTDDDVVLWISGCSVSHGVGVERSQRYGEILSKKLQLPCNYLTLPGASIEWSADQILRSDIQKHDVIIWGLTSEHRAPKIENGFLGAWLRKTKQDLDYLYDETRYYKALTSVYQVSNFCQKIGARLLIFPLVCSERLQLDLMLQSNYYQTPYQFKFVDFGTDGSHPGPKQHNIWAEFCIEKISQWPKVI